MKVVGYTSPEVLEVLAAPTTRLRPVSLEIMLSPDEESTVPLAMETRRQLLGLARGASLTVKKGRQEVKFERL